MKNKPVICILFTVLFALFLVHHAAAQSQHEMNRTAEENFVKADARLNAVYKKVLAELDAEGRKKLQASERAWLAYRDADADYQADGERGGSLAPYIYASTRTRLTKLRIQELAPEDEPVEKKK